MSLDALVTLVVLVVMFATLTRDRVPPSLVLLTGLTTLVLADVVDVATGFAGFGAEAPLTVAALYVVAHGARRTGLLAPVTTRLLRGDGGPATILRMGVPVAGTSALFNNTPLVAMLIPEVTSWARRNDVSVSRLLMPLSFAAVLGGTVTLIGTSTNLVVSGVLDQQGLGPLGFFEQAPIGIVVAVVGLVALAGVGVRLLPDRRDPTTGAVETLRDYAMHLEVDHGGPLVGLDLAAAGLRGLTGVYLADIVRGERRLGPVAPDEVLEGGDLLVFVGDASGVIDLRDRPGLRAPDEQDDVLADATAPKYFDVVIGRGSPLVGRTLKEIGGRDGYRAAAIAIHRAGEPVGGKLGEVRLRAGDMLVVFADRDLQRSRRATEDFLLIAAVDEVVPVVRGDARWVVLAMLAFVVTGATGLLSVLEGALVAAGILVATRTVRFQEAKRAVDLDVVLMVAAALGVGAAVELSGLAGDVAGAITGLLGGFGRAGVVLGVLVSVMALTEVVTNNAAAAVLTPIALRTAEVVDVDPRTMAIGVAIMASASFLTPIGYQTNAMVYGPGGYRFGDFTRVGGIITLTSLIATTAGVLLLG